MRGANECIHGDNPDSMLGYWVGQTNVMLLTCCTDSRATGDLVAEPFIEFKPHGTQHGMWVRLHRYLLDYGQKELNSLVARMKTHDTNEQSLVVRYSVDGSMTVSLWREDYDIPGRVQASICMEELDCEWLEFFDSTLMVMQLAYKANL